MPSPTQQLLALNEPRHFKPAGLPWSTESQARWAYRCRAENGLKGVFKRQGKRVFVDVVAYHAAMSRNVA
jgi:hypothetical protein